jgi:hypothetical protein
MVTLTELQFLCGDARTFQTDNHLLQHFTNQAFMVEWPDESHFSKKHMTALLGVCQKARK